MTKVKKDERVYMVPCYPADYQIACMAMKFSQNNEQPFAHLPITYLLKGDCVIGGVGIADVAKCLKVGLDPYDTEDMNDMNDRYGKETLELDRIYLPILEQ
jgi:hypothetical protein